MVEFDPSRYRKWKEVYVATDKGKREVHYYLKRRNGSGSDLVVVGRETTLRHFSYRYAFQGNSASLAKLRSRREVVDWLDSIVNSEKKSFKSAGPAHTPSESIKAVVEGPNVFKKLEKPTNQLAWVGSPWTCRKKRAHYPSFCRNGVNISVHDFVYVLGVEGDRLVAHLDDMYEDSKGNKIVVVQWFHKIDEVGTDLPQHYYDREIYFSLCLQDLSIECIDGLATVLSPEHYEIYLNGATRSQMEPFVCHRLFDNDEVKSFDVTKVKGYWKQDLVKCFDPRKKHQPADDGKQMEKKFTDAAENRPRKRLRKSGQAIQSDNKNMDVGSLQNEGKSVINKSNGQMGLGGVLREIPPSLPNGSAVVQKNRHLDIGSRVEVLSEDSGIRGCWFRALIVKKHKQMVKVQYQDVIDAGDESKKLEEWILALKIAASDELGIRIGGRTTVRPDAPKSQNGNVMFNTGTIVDVFLHDGWWEGIVIEKKTKDRFRVYFPGEKQESVFSSTDLRLSREWVDDDWKQLKDRPDLALKIYGRITKKASVSPKTNSVPVESEKADKENKQPNEAPAVRDLSKDDVFLQLKWKTSGRRRSRSPVQKLRFVVHDNRRKRADDPNKAASYQKLFDIGSVNGNSDNCGKADSGFGSTNMVTSLVLTR